MEERGIAEQGRLPGLVVLSSQNTLGLPLKGVLDTIYYWRMCKRKTDHKRNIILLLVRQSREEMRKSEEVSGKKGDT